MRLFTKSEFARLAGVSPAAVGKAIKTGRIKVTGEGRKAKIDPDCYKSIQYLKVSNIQRDATGRPQPIKKPVKRKQSNTKQKKPKAHPGKIIPFTQQAQKKIKPKIKTQKKTLQITGPKPAPPPTKKELEIQNEIDKKIELLEQLGHRYDIAKTIKIEEQATSEKLKNARTRGELIDREKIYNNMFMYLDKLHSNLERLADSFLSDIGPLMVDAGKVMPEHRESWKNEVLSQIDESKEAMVKILRKIEKDQSK